MHLADRTRTAPEAVSWSIAGRLAVAYAASALVLIAAASGLLYWVLVANVSRENEQYLMDEVHILRSLIRDRPDDLEVLRQEAEWEEAARRYARVYIRILDEQSRVIVETPGASRLIAAAPLEPSPAHAPPGPAVKVVAPDGTPLLMLAAWASRGAAGTERRLVQIALDATAHRELVGRYRASLWGVLGLALVLAGAVGYTLARRAMHPLAAITKTAREIRSSTLDRRLPTDGLPSELSSLAETFNQMMARLEQAFLQLSMLALDLAHELRTPLNNLRGEVEVALTKPRGEAEYRAALESALEECVHLSETIDALLFLVRSDHPGASVARAPVDVPAALQSVCELHEAAALERGLTLTIHATTCRTAALDRTLFQRAVSNLLSNAVAHTPSGGHVTVATVPEGTTLRVDVSDTGDGIPPEYLARVSDRFFRGKSTATGGLGLGLAIVKSIMIVHQGTLSLRSERGCGTTATLRFPDAVIGADTSAGSVT